MTTAPKQTRPPRAGLIITAHKGGRTARFPGAKLTPATLQSLKDICADRDESFGDWVERHVAADLLAATSPQAGHTGSQTETPA